MTRCWTKIGIVTPSRVIMHSRTAEAVLANMQDVAHWRWFLSHDLPIPDCFNDTVGRAYEWGADLIWIVEDDVLPPPGTLAAMLSAIVQGADIAVSDYLMERLGSVDGSVDYGVCRDGAGHVTWCRTGCILFKRECLDVMPSPWFTLHNRLVKPGVVTWDEGEERGYGADIPFTLALYQLGFTFAVIDITCDHLRVVEWGNARGSNHGYHRIEPLGGTEWHESTEQTPRSRSARPAIAR